MLLDYLFVERCRSCGAFLEYGACGLFTVCQECWAPIAIQEAHIQPLSGGAQAVLVASGATYSDALKTMVFRLKYDHDRLVVRDLSLLLDKAYLTINQHLPELSSAYLVPIPLHFFRQFRRGYNQAQLLASELSRKYGHKCCEGLLLRTKSTKAHHGLGKAERLVNVSGAFKLGKTDEVHKDGWIILVDDIYTSGATMAEATRVLFGGGYHRIACVTVARAVLQ